MIKSISDFKYDKNSHNNKNGIKNFNFITTI